MNSKVMQILNNPSASLSRNGFDRSKRDIFSCKSGVLNLVSCIDCVPNSHYEINPVLFTRTNAFNEANFVRMRQELNFYFVPYSSMFTPFNEFLEQTSDPKSAIYQRFANEANLGTTLWHRVPTFDLGALVWNLMYAASHDQEFIDSLFLSTPGYDFNTFQTTAESWLNAVPTGDSGAFGTGLDVFFADGEVVKDLQGYSLWQGTVRLLDMAGYGNFLPLMKLNYLTLSTSEDKLEASVSRVLQDLHGKYVNIWHLAAYQAVCKNYYWNTTYSKPDVASWNFDDVSVASSFDVYNNIYLQTTLGSAGRLARLRGLFGLNYRPWRPDYFTGSVPSAQFGNVSVQSTFGSLRFHPAGGNVTTGSPLVGVGTSVGDDGSQAVGLRSTASSPLLSGQFGGLSFSVLELRAAQALQQWREAIGRSGYRTSDRLEATFGKRPRFDQRANIIPLGSWSADIMKDVVTGTSGAEFAEHAATGSAMLDNVNFKFDTDGDFGVIIGVMNITPLAEYDAYGVDPLNIKIEPFDYHTPAFNNLGLQPVLSHELSVFGNSLVNGDSVLGYVPRWAEYKQSVDRVHGEFCSQPVGMPVVAGGSAPVGEFEQFVSTRIDLESWTGSVRQFYVDPAIVDHIFVQAADGSQSSDQFQCNLYTEVKCVQPMSVLGIPQFN